MPRIAFAFDLDFAYSNEVYHSLRASGPPLVDGWEVVPLAYDFETVAVELLDSGRIDALAGSFLSDSWLETLGREDLPMVNLSWLSTIQSVPTVTVDDVAVGRLAAENLLERGWEHLAFAGNPGLHFSRLREKGFAEVVRNGGGDVRELPISQAPAAARWLRETPEGTAVFCASDPVASRVAQLARQESRRIPEEVGILGVGNSPLESVFAGVEISSIPLPSEGIGRQAARILQTQLGEGPVPARSYLLPPGSLVERESTRRAGSQDRVLEKALQFMRANYGRELGVEEVAQHAGVSRRSLELRFQQHLGHGPYGEIQQLRLERAEELLRDTDLKILEVAALCGFPEQHRFSAFFKKWKKLAPKAFRSKMRGSFSLQTPAT